MARFQMFDTPHRALRLAFAQLTNQAGKTDYSSETELIALKATMEAAFSMVKSHSHHEDDICFADLDQIVPNATQHDRSEHVRLHHRLDTILDHTAGMLTVLKAGNLAPEEGRELYTDLCNLNAEMLLHMMEEERDTQPIFWQHMTDEQLMAFEPRILAAMSPEMSAIWMRYIIPSQPFKELLGMFTGMKNAAPAFVFEGNLQLAREILPANEYKRLATALQHTPEMAFAN